MVFKGEGGQKALSSKIDNGREPYPRGCPMLPTVGSGQRDPKCSCQKVLSVAKSEIEFRIQAIGSTEGSGRLVCIERRNRSASEHGQHLGELAGMFGWILKDIPQMLVKEATISMIYSVLIRRSHCFHHMTVYLRKQVFVYGYFQL